MKSTIHSMKRHVPGSTRHPAWQSRILCVVLVLSLALCLQQGAIAAATKKSSAAPPPKLPQTEEAPIPVATDAGIKNMTQRDYEEYVKPMGHLPTMSKAYVFGHTIAQPKTDKLGHIHLSGAAPAEPVDPHK